jgi:predicted phage baseplate assembly protein
VWRTLDPAAGEVRDDTRAFTLDGSVKLRLPEAMGSQTGDQPYYLSVSLASGDYDTPPMLKGVFPNALPVEQSVEVTATLGPSDGRPHQHFSLPKRAVAAGSLQLASEEPVAGAPGTTVQRTWSVRHDLDASSGTAAHLVVDEAAAEIAFGDGDHGRIPPFGSLLQATYLATLADKGNLDAAQAIRFEITNPLTLANESAALLAFSMPFGPHTGAARETVGQAAARAVRLLQTPTRATTPGDYEYLANTAPGTAIARVRALPGTHPSFPCMKAPGVVTVLIVPDQRRLAPKPSAGLLELVRRYLDRRRTLGTHIEVVGPKYTRVTVHAIVKLHRGASAERVREDVLAALNTFLHPLKGGPAVLARSTQATSQALASSQRSAVPTNMPAPGITLITSQQPLSDELPATPPPPPGWPFGRDVYRAEVLQLIDGVPGVDNVLKLEMSVEGGESGCGNICVGPTSLVMSGAHTVKVER